jgi:hypothetical protein
MEFQGRIAKLLPIRQGVSQRTGNEWKSLPFIFEYFENPSDRYADSVMLETFDENVINNIKEGMEVRCGFGHKTREYTKDDKTMTINDIRLYKIECVRNVQQPAPAPKAQQAAAPFPPQVDTNGNPITNQGGKDDDLPF